MRRKPTAILLGVFIMIGAGCGSKEKETGGSPEASEPPQQSSAWLQIERVASAPVEVLVPAGTSALMKDEGEGFVWATIQLGTTEIDIDRPMLTGLDANKRGLVSLRGDRVSFVRETEDARGWTLVVKRTDLDPPWGVIVLREKPGLVCSADSVDESEVDRVVAICETLRFVGDK